MKTRIACILMVCVLAIFAAPTMLVASPGNYESASDLPPAPSGSMRIGMYAEETEINGLSALKVTVNTALAADAVFGEIGIAALGFFLDYPTEFLEVATGEFAPTMLLGTNLDVRNQRRRFPAIPGNPPGIARIELQAPIDNLNNYVTGLGDVAEIYFFIDTDNPNLVPGETQFSFAISLTEAYGSWEYFEFHKDPARLEHPLTWTFGVLDCAHENRTQENCTVCDDCDETDLPQDCDDNAPCSFHFGDVPSTGVASVFVYVIAMFGFFVVSVAMWFFVIRRDFSRGV